MFNRTRVLAQKYGRKLAGVGTGLSLVVGQAHAAIPAAAQTALDDLKTDASAVAGIVLAAVIIVFAIKFARKGL